MTMGFYRCARWMLVIGSALGASATAFGQDVVVDMSRYRPACGVGVRQDRQRLHVAWRLGERNSGRLTLDLRKGQPLIESLRIAKEATETVEPVLQRVEPLTF